MAASQYDDPFKTISKDSFTQENYMDRYTFHITICIHPVVLNTTCTNDT